MPAVSESTWTYKHWVSACVQCILTGLHCKNKLPPGKVAAASIFQQTWAEQKLHFHWIELAKVKTREFLLSHSENPLVLTLSRYCLCSLHALHIWAFSASSHTSKTCFLNCRLNVSVRGSLSTCGSVTDQRTVRCGPAFPNSAWVVSSLPGATGTLIDVALLFRNSKTVLWASWWSANFKWFYRSNCFHLRHWRKVQKRTFGFSKCKPLFWGALNSLLCHATALPL